MSHLELPGLLRRSTPMIQNSPVPEPQTPAHVTRKILTTPASPPRLFTCLQFQAPPLVMLSLSTGVSSIFIITTSNCSEITSIHTDLLTILHHPYSVFFHFLQTRPRRYENLKTSDYLSANPTLGTFVWFMPNEEEAVKIISGISLYSKIKINVTQVEIQETKYPMREAEVARCAVCGLYLIHRHVRKREERNVRKKFHRCRLNLMNLNKVPRMKIKDTRSRCL